MNFTSHIHYMLVLLLEPFYLTLLTLYSFFCFSKKLSHLQSFILIQDPPHHVGCYTSRKAGSDSHIQFSDPIWMGAMLANKPIIHPHVVGKNYLGHLLEFALVRNPLGGKHPSLDWVAKASLSGSVNGVGLRHLEPIN
jgi:hypothetical protein